jgi:hypothetical protein
LKSFNQSSAWQEFASINKVKPVTPRLMRKLAYKVTYYATREEQSIHRAWRLFVIRQLDSINGDAKALVWSIGIAWGLRGERVIGSITPATNCLLLFPALFCSSHFLIRHLVWYGVPPVSHGLSNDARGLIRLALCAGILALVGCVAPGHMRRRVFVASAFPVMGLTGLLGAACGMELVTAAGLAHHYGIALAVMRGIGLGVAMTAVLALPALLLYRDVAAPVVVLSLMPAIARSNWMAKIEFGASVSLADLLWRAWPFVCTAIGILVATAICRRWQRYLLLPMTRSPDST